MKIALASDVHLEFGPLELKNTEGADVLILSGDIIVASQLNDYDANNIMGENTRSQVWHKFFQECAAEFPNVIYIMGNHEHYHGDYAKSYEHLLDKLSYIPNLHILEKQIVTFDDEFVFFGGTLWTDMNQGDELTMNYVHHRMNDYNVLNSNSDVSFRDELGVFRTRNGHLTPDDTRIDHGQYMQALRSCLEVYNDRKFIVVGHHAPSKKSTKPQYERDIHLNGAYSSDLSEFMLDHPQIKLWTHGHTHHNFDYMIGETRIVCNPRGYIGYERQADTWELQYFEV